MMKDASQYQGQKYSPSWLKHILDFGISCAVSVVERYFSKSSKKYFAQSFVAILLALLYFSLFYVFHFTTYFINSNKTDFFEARYFWIIPSLVPLVLISDVIASAIRLSQTAIIFVTTAIAFYVIPEVLSFGNHGYIPNIIRLALVFTLSFHTLVLLLTRHLRFNTRLIIFFAAEILLIFYMSTQAVFSFYSESFWICQPYRYIFMFTILSSEITGMKLNDFLNFRFLTYITNPANLITPLPILYQDWKPSSEKDRLRSRAVIFLIFGFIALITSTLMHFLQRHSWANHHGDYTQMFFYGGPASYLYVFCYSYANITIPVALAWWFGFKLPDAYDMPLLATTPQDRWRRWNFLFYEWYFRFIFFPIFKLTKNQFFAIMVTFAATLFIHLGPMNSEIIYKFIHEPFSRKLMRKAAFFLAHGLLVYLGMKYHKYLPKPDKITGWIGVVVMFVLMSMVHYIYML